jgi:hypothetical protein
MNFQTIGQTVLPATALILILYALFGLPEEYSMKANPRTADNMFYQLQLRDKELRIFLWI